MIAMNSWDQNSNGSKSSRWNRLRIAFEKMAVFSKLVQVVLFTAIVMLFITAQIIVMLLELLKGGDERRDH